MLRLLRARVFDWLLMAVAVTIGAVVLPAMSSSADSTEYSLEINVKMVFLFMGIFIVGDLALRTTFFAVSFVANKYCSETLRKHLRDYGIGISRSE